MLKEGQVIVSSSSSEYNSAVIESKTVFKNDTAIRFVHWNEIYILRITKGNKLILTK